MRIATEPQNPDVAGCVPKLELNVALREARSEDAEDIARIHVRSWQESYRGILHAEYLISLNLEEKILSRREQLKKPHPTLKTFIAQLEGRTIGFCDAGCSTIRDVSVKGKVHALYLLDAYKGRGIGTRLWAVATAYLKEKNLSPYMNWVLEDNFRARSFYETKGGKLFLKRGIEFGGRLYQKVAYRYDE